MNSQSENNTWLENLIQNNGQAMEEIQETPYQPIFYAVPKEWIENWMKLLEQAVEFQPTLYRLISLLATRKELEQMQVSAAAASANGEAGHADNHPMRTATGWENERAVFYRYIENALRQSQGYGRYGTAFGAAHFEEGRQGFHPVGGAVGAGLRSAAALGQLIDNDSDDPEEQRKKIEAQQAASNLGAVIGLAAGIIGALTEEEKEEDQSIQEEKGFKEFLAEMDREYEYEEEQNWQQTM